MHVDRSRMRSSTSTYALLLLAPTMYVRDVQGLLDPAAMARMALGEALTNLMWARATALADVKASVNWMYAAKLGSEGAAMYDAAVALKCGAAIVSFLRTSLAELGDDLCAAHCSRELCRPGLDLPSHNAQADFLRVWELLSAGLP